MHIVPSISSLTRSCSSEAAMPLGCLSVLVTWLNLTTISPSSQAAETAVADTLMARAVAAAVRNFMDVSSHILRRCNQRPCGATGKDFRMAAIRSRHSDEKIDDSKKLFHNGALSGAVRPNLNAAWQHCAGCRTWFWQAVRI